MLRVDPVLFEQVLFNLIDNAAKYAPEDTTITIRGWKDGDAIMLSVATKVPASRQMIWSGSSTVSIA